MTQNQLEGSIFAAVIVTLSYMAIFFVTKYPLSISDIPPGNGHSVSLIVELAGYTKGKGIYYLPEGAKLRDLLQRAKIGKDGLNKTGGLQLDRMLKTGCLVFIEENRNISFGDMRARKKIALDIPIDVNRATIDDLKLVPGIGAVTARQIADHRQKSGGFKKIEDLMNIKGIKKKKLDAFRGYLTIGDGGSRR